MATYTHFAKQPDVLKHLILCEVLRNEAPQVYVETNSACAIYSMTQTPEQQYGIYHFLEKADDDKSLKDSIYYQLESTEMAKGNYQGSPALAMNVLGKQVKRFVFFDLEKSALENVDIYAKQIELSTSVEIHHTDSLKGTIELLPSLPASSFIHIDPYEIDKKGDSGVTYLDILIQATQLGMKCLLWYGFMTGDDKASLDNYIVSSLEKAGIKDYIGVELTMNSIKKIVYCVIPAFWEAVFWLQMYHKLPKISFSITVTNWLIYTKMLNTKIMMEVYIFSIFDIHLLI